MYEHEIGTWLTDIGKQFETHESLIGFTPKPQLSFKRDHKICFILPQNPENGSTCGHVIVITNYHCNQDKNDNTILTVKMYDSAYGSVSRQLAESIAGKYNEPQR